MNWKKSSRSETGNCVELARAHDGCVARDSKNPDGPVMRPVKQMKSFLDAVKEGSLDMHE
jgi:hypothetical protein